MGIPGILKEIGKGERVALAKLAIDHLERSHRPLRIAIDAAIWNFQTQAGQGGKNPALRTLFYRLVKLLALPIDPVFVYDGKNKPLTKRGRTVVRYGSCISNETSKKLIQAFRFPYHSAPGEAEAECAMLQRRGLVDAVMSQDVDTIMFGSTLTLRDWTKEASKHNKSPTHVNALDLPRIKSLSGLDPDGMILVALLSGGDYDEAGVAGIGSTLACEIARAGFGTDLLDLVRKGDEAGIQEWRERLQFELESNESGYFKVKRKSVKIPESFPDRRILGYYLNPAVTPDGDLTRLERDWTKAWQSDIDIRAMREHVGETFDWLYKPGAWKFIRVMAPALLASRLLRKTAGADIRSADQITERRQHFVSDGIPELRITVIPAEVVGLDLDAEEDSPEYLARLAAEKEDPAAKEVGSEEEDANVPARPLQQRKTPPWRPDVPEKMWVAEAIVDIGAREHLASWREIQREIENSPKKFASRKSAKPKDTRRQKDLGGMHAGALLNYMVSSKAQSDMVSSKAQSDMVSSKAQSDMAAPTDSISNPSSSQPQSKAGGDTTRVPKTSTLTASNKSADRPPRSVRDFFTPRKSRQVLDAAEGPLKNGLLSRNEPAPDREEVLIVTTPEAARRKEVPETVTQRKNRRRGGKGAEVNESEPKTATTKVQTPSRSPVQRRQNTKRILAPSIARSKQKKPLIAGAISDATTTELDALPADLSTGLATSFAATGVHAIPRPSLPGTWKAVEGEPSSNFEMHPSSSRPPRVSIVDLTSS